MPPPPDASMLLRGFAVAAVTSAVAGYLYYSRRCASYNSNLESQLPPHASPFERAVARGRGGISRLRSAHQLKLYALYKQATQGDFDGRGGDFAPGAGGREAPATGGVAHYKYEAWRGLRGVSVLEAQHQYTLEVDRFLGGAADDGESSEDGDEDGLFATRGLGMSVPTMRRAQVDLAAPTQVVDADKAVTASDVGRLLMQLIEAGNTADIRRVLASPEPASFTREVLLTRDEFGQTALHWAADRGLADVLASLLALVEARDRAGVLSATDSDGLTPLHTAAVAENGECVRALLTAGADSEALTNDGESAADLSTETAVQALFG